MQSPNRQIKITVNISSYMVVKPHEEDIFVIT